MIMLLLTMNTFAEESINSIEDKISNQNIEIRNKIKESKIEGVSDEDIDAVVNAILSSTSRSTEKINSFTDIKKNAVEGLFRLALSFRKYAVPFYMFILITNIFLAGTIGSKSLSRRKAYIIGSVILTVVFIVFMNVPIFIIYYQNTPNAGSIDSFYIGMYRFILFLRNNSIAICSVLFILGVLNSILGLNNIPRKVAGQFYKRVAIIMLLVLWLLPPVVNFIL